MTLYRGRWRGLRGDIWLGAIMLMALGLRTYHIAYPPWDYHNWRQTQTLMLARDFARHGFDLLHPQVQWVGNSGPNGPSYFSGEFSIESVLAALLYKAFGEKEFLARIVVIAFSLLGIYFLYELLNRRAGRMAARMGAFLYALLPYHVFFGRVFMPDVPALSLALGGLFFLDRWTDDRKRATLLLAAALTALAILQKLTVVFVGLPALYLFWLALGGRRLFAQAELYIFAAVAGAPSIAWYAHTKALSRGSGFAFVQPGLFGHHMGSWLQAGFLHRILAPLPSEAFAPAGLALALVGFFWPTRSPAFWIFRLWTAGAGVLLLLIPDLLSINYYYYSLLLPGGAALGGLALARMASNRTTYPLMGVLLAVFAMEAIRTALPLYQEDRAPRDLGMVLSHLTAPSDLIAGETGGSPNVLYFADRRGWMLAQQYDLGLVKKLAAAGATYYADPSTADLAQRRKFFQSMDMNFKRLSSDEGPWPIYRLTPETESLRGLPETEVPLHTNFGDEVELVGVSVRKLGESPASFEVIYFWRRLKEPAADLQFLIQVANGEGGIVYEAKYRPGSEGKAGEIVRGESVVVPPGSLARARYQIWAGWVDSARATRLAVIGPDVESRHDCVRIGEYEIRQTPGYGWFGAN